MKHDLRGIYITRRQCIKDSEGQPKRVVTGHYISFRGSRRVVHSFRQCTLSKVIATAKLVIHNPRVFLCEEQENLWMLGYLDKNNTQTNTNNQG